MNEFSVFRFNEKIETSMEMNETFRNNVHVLRRKLTLTDSGSAIKGVFVQLKSRVLFSMFTLAGSFGATMQMRTRRIAKRARMADKAG